MRQKQRVFSLFLLSPSSRRAWIEIRSVHALAIPAFASPSSRRAWIEIIELIGEKDVARGRPTHGGRG